MFRRRARPSTEIVAAMVLPLLAYVVLRIWASMDLTVATPKGHFYVVSMVALLATMVAVALGMSATRLRNIKVTFVSLAFISLAGVFTIHGLATPGFILSPTHLPDVAAQLAVTFTVGWLWLSSSPSDSPVIAFLARRQSYVVPIWVFLVVVLGVAVMVHPEMVDWIPVTHGPLRWFMLVVTIVAAYSVARRYYESYQASGFPLQRAVTVSALWLIDAQIIMTTGVMWHLSWWIYHVLLILATVVTMTGILRQYASGDSIGAAVRGLFETDPVARIEDGISPSIRALIVATEVRDPYTAGHNFRVALYALRIGTQLGLDSHALRALAQGGVVHDVGKIHVPDSILNKPGALTAEERLIIEQHPVTGYEMCMKLGFLKEELDIIRHHHERWDGKGYPDKLAGEQIPFLARVLAVADVYDALTSVRSYRKAWAHDEAIRFLSEHAGTQFDEQCVQAWVEVSKSGVRIDRYPSWSVYAENGRAVPS